MTLVFSVTCCGCLLVAMLIMLSIAKNLVNSQNNERMKKTISWYAEKANTWFSSASAALGPMTIYMEQADGNDAAAIRSFNEQMTSRYVFASDIYSAEIDGTFYDGTGWIPDEGWSCTARDWFTLPIKKNGTVYGKPYVDVISGELVTYISTPYYRNGEIAGVCSMDTYLTELTEIMNSIAEIY